MRHPVAEEAVTCTGDDLERTVGYVPFPVQSACKTGEKDHDRLAVARLERTWFATVCDGATQSVYSVDAAEILSQDPPALWKDGALSERVRLLVKLRQALLSSELPEPVDEASFLSRSMAGIVRDKQRHAYQSTFVSVRMTMRSRGTLLEARWCGDSALLVFDELGRLVHSNLKLENATLAFEHASPFTEVLPDHYTGESLSCAFKIGAGSHVVLCSDGFYDAFTDPGALFRWLLLNGRRLDAAVEDLHRHLDQYRGDDDISFVWLCPCDTETSSSGTKALAPESLGPRRGVLAAFFRRVLHGLFRRGPVVSIGGYS
jgi:serine/threonine protein phosphatase PrpC